MVRTCSSCGCTDVTPCNDDGMPCHWVAPERCSACPTKVVDAKIVDVALMPGGLIETTIAGTLEDGRTFTGVWPGQITSPPPTPTEETP